PCKSITCLYPLALHISHVGSVVSVSFLLGIDVLPVNKLNISSSNSFIDSFMNFWTSFNSLASTRPSSLMKGFNKDVSTFTISSSEELIVSIVALSFLISLSLIRISEFNLSSLHKDSDKSLAILLTNTLVWFVYL